MRDWGLALRSIVNEIVLIMEHTINLLSLLLIPLLFRKGLYRTIWPELRAQEVAELEMCWDGDSYP